MENMSAKDLMVPISEYAMVRIGTTLLDAIFELEKAQEAFSTNKYQHRAILVLDDNDLVVGKIGQLRILKAIESYHDLNEDVQELQTFRFSEEYISNRREYLRTMLPVLTRESLEAACQKKVEDFMQKLTPGEFVSQESSVDVVIHRLVSGAHLSLLVTGGEGKEIVGVLRIADVFAAAFHKMKELGFTPQE